jgi:hypothetical protein
VLALVYAARAAGNPAAAEPALDFMRTQGLRDVRINAGIAVPLASR